jgi:uncharacterized protein YkwD
MRRSLCCAFLVVVALAAAPLATGTTKTPTQRETALEQGILREVNRVRGAHGLRALVLSRGLQAAATYQSRILLEQGVFDHDSAAGGAFGDRLRRFYPVGAAHSWSVGENLLWSSGGIDASAAVKRWLDSATHRRIIFDPSWREFGVGAVSTPAAPGVYSTAGPVVVVTLDFGARTSSSRTT